MCQYNFGQRPTMYFECFVCGWATCTKAQNLEKQKQNKKFLLECTYNRSKFQNHWIVCTYMLWWESWSENLEVVLSRMSKDRKIIYLNYDMTIN